VSFVYNNKLPFHLWGVANVGFDSYGIPVNGTADHGRLTVPIPEAGAPLAYRYTPIGATASSSVSTFAAKFEDTPCDAQLPIVDVLWQPESSYAYGLVLTLHGELYKFPAVNLRWSIGQGANAVTDRRLARITSADVAEPFTKLCECSRVTVNGVRYGPAAISRSGRVLRIAHFDGVFSGGRWNGRPMFDEISTPAPAEWYYDDASVQVVTTTEPRTYIRSSSASQWYTLTTGCHLIQITGVLNAQFQSQVPPVATVDSPPSGTTATVAVEWAGAGTVGDPYTINAIRITNSGSGYTADPSVTFSVAPTSGSAQIKLKVFTSTLRKTFSSGSLFLSDDNKIWALEAPVAPSGGLTSYALRWATEHKTTTTTANANGTFDKPLSSVSWSVSGNPGRVASRKYLLDTSGALFELNELGRVTGSNTSDYNPELVAKFEKLNDGPWKSVAFGGDFRGADAVCFCGVKTGGTMWTWGKNGESTSSLQYALLADGTNVAASRTTPAQVASEAEWLQVYDVAGRCFLAIRKDAICRDIDQPMEYWPDWHFGG